jgi:hypothetical protein
MVTRPLLSFRIAAMLGQRHHLAASQQPSNRVLTAYSCRRVSVAIDEIKPEGWAEKVAAVFGGAIATAIVE